MEALERLPRWCGDTGCGDRGFMTMWAPRDRRLGSRRLGGAAAAAQAQDALAPAEDVGGGDERRGQIGSRIWEVEGQNGRPGRWG